MVWVLVSIHRVGSTKEQFDAIFADFRRRRTTALGSITMHSEVANKVTPRRQYARPDWRQCDGDRVGAVASHANGSTTRFYRNKNAQPLCKLACACAPSSFDRYALQIIGQTIAVVCKHSHSSYGCTCVFGCIPCVLNTHACTRMLGVMTADHAHKLRGTYVL